MLKAEVIKKRREFTVRVSLQLERGSALGLFGASGAGKSTVLACIAGIEDPDEGDISFDNLRIFPPPLALHLRPFGYITQEPQLFPHLSVRDNVMFGVRKGKAAEAEAWIERLRDRLRLGPFWNAPASRVSGGQARRVALARALARKPPLLLLDEPFAGLDRHLVRELIDDLNAWRQELAFGIIAVDHNVEVLRRLCPERAIVLESGSAIQDGTWDEISAAPASPLLRSLLAAL